jgi:Na+-transporting methylmalonyl-CoA/oxaloacetate decarboxylase gamma subunit
MNDALLITIIGGGLVFAGLILLWLMMAALVKLTSKTMTLRQAQGSLFRNKKKMEKPGDLTVQDEEDTDLECKQMAAAAAVCAVMALMNSSFTASSHKEKETISPWQNLYRNIQINQANSLQRRKKE